VTPAKLDSKHLAELHARAAELGVPGYRRLRRDELIAELKVREGDESASEETEAERPASEEAEGPAAEEADVQLGDDAEAPPAEEAEDAEPPAKKGRAKEEEATGEPVTGVLDVLSAGHGFLRLRGLEPDPDDVYISASQIRRCELRAGDQVEGPARQPRRGERHPALVRVERVNGEEPGEERSAGFEELTPVTPRRRIPISPDSDDVLVRAVDLLAPLAFGQRVLVVSEPHSGRTTLLRALVKAIGAADDAPGVIVLLVDERPEEVTEWKRQATGVEIAAAPSDLDATDQVRHAELAVARAKRRAESGEDVVVIVDSLTRLGVAYRDPIAVKPVFGAGRELEEDGSGSLTMIATVLKQTDDGEGAVEAVETTENATIVLDAELAAAGVFPAIDVARTIAVAEDQLRDGPELEAARRLREELGAADPRAAAEALAEQIRSSASNAELLSSP
jgi:transcription termination factor Rho